jgi:hypothetical protein
VSAISPDLAKEHHRKSVPRGGGSFCSSCINGVNDEPFCESAFLMEAIGASKVSQG